MLCSLLLPVSPALHAETGTVVDFRFRNYAVGAELYRGLVESPDGKKEIVRQGDIIDLWKVVNINEHCIILSKDAKHTKNAFPVRVKVRRRQKKRSILQLLQRKRESNQTRFSKRACQRFKKVIKVALLQALDGLALKGPI